jgi:hypothetical protein
MDAITDSANSARAARVSRGRAPPVRFADTSASACAHARIVPSRLLTAIDRYT